MFWLMWIAVMVAIPVVAGVQVWWQMRRDVQDFKTSAAWEEPGNRTALRDRA